MWEKELNRIYQSLLIKLIAPQKTKLVETQINWAKQIDLEKDFLYSFEDLQIKIGREGIFITAMNFMNKRTNIRIRRSSN
ncbi:hypothetical protein LNP81_00355 [Flavobacterium sp. F-30]|uniref:Lysozyme inhibitor LprI-like N-terminal domain-containing protein n=1 Tax=Flavobacterium piscisymbiosum TaxID=2893753 RepID=A0ABS8M7G4_9FLAO|nr:hypothetical protein [Flavobacterium sp. F-30]